MLVSSPNLAQAIPGPSAQGAGLEFSVRALQEPSGRFWPELGQLNCAFDISHGTLWSFMEFAGRRPSYNLPLLDDFHNWQRNIAQLKAEVGTELRYVVLGSRHPKVFCLGGDLDYFSACIEARDRDALLAYGRSCITILYRNWISLDSDVITIGLAQGDALGGGFESLLSFDVLVAERGVKLGFPEQMFGLFPGMGALSFMGRKLGFAKAEQLIRSGTCLLAEEMYELGVVNVLAEPGQGVEAVKRYIAKTDRRHASQYLFHEAAKRANPMDFEELDDIVRLWADACLTLDRHDLAIIKRLVTAQSKLPAAAFAAA
jgi:DSF synthase